MIEVADRPSIARLYQQAQAEALAVRHPSPGILRVSGEDRLDFLNRMSTNDLLRLAPGNGAVTVFTTAIGRIVEVARVLAQPEQALLLTRPGGAASLLEWLQRYLFFQDRVALEERAGPWAHWGIYGPRADQVARAAAFDLAELQPGRHVELPGGTAWAVSQPLPGLELLLDGEAAQRAERAWRSGRSAEHTYEVLRIEAGQPAPGRELTDEAIPLEVGLWQAVSFSKGCYIGQEIIARMESRGKLARQLVGLRLERPTEPGTALRQGEMVQGHLTSVAESPRLGWIGLAVVRPAALSEAGGEVLVGSDGARGRLIQLPFP